MARTILQSGHEIERRDQHGFAERDLTGLEHRFGALKQRAERVQQIVVFFLRRFDREHAVPQILSNVPPKLAHYARAVSLILDQDIPPILRVQAARKLGRGHQVAKHNREWATLSFRVGGVWLFLRHEL